MSTGAQVQVRPPRRKRGLRLYLGALRHWRRFWPQLRDTARLIGPSARLLTTLESHTYAYSVSANALLASAPFLFLLIWCTGSLSPHIPSEHIIRQLVNDYLPMGQNALLRDATLLAHRHTVQAASLVMLAISASGVFLPLEVALNGIWGFPRSRGYIGNQAIALALVIACGAVLVTEVVLAGVFWGAVTAILPVSWTTMLRVLSFLLLKLFSIPASILVFFLVYWWLPNGHVSALQVFPAAIYTGLLAEIFKDCFREVLPMLHFRAIYATLELPVTMLVWGYCGALLLLFGASLSARGVARLPARIHLPRFTELRAWYAAHEHAGKPTVHDGR